MQNSCLREKATGKSTKGKEENYVRKTKRRGKTLKKKKIQHTEQTPALKLVTRTHKQMYICALNSF